MLPNLDTSAQQLERLNINTDSPQKKPSYERRRDTGLETPLSPTASTASSRAENIRYRETSYPANGIDPASGRHQPFAPSPPLSPTATFSSISQVSSGSASNDTSDFSSHWAKHVIKHVSSTRLPWIQEESRYHERQGSRERSFPNEDYNDVLALHWPEGLRVTLYCRPTDYRAKIVAQYRDYRGVPDYACLPLESLWLSREQGSLLRVNRRRSGSKSNQSLPWLTMKFTTIERLVLFAGTFMAMRSQDPIGGPQAIPVEDDELDNEVMEFSAPVRDNGYRHALRIFRDEVTGAIRLLASVHKGPMDRTPVWTSFITHTITSLEWCRRLDAKTVGLAELRQHLFIAKDRYDPAAVLAGDGSFLLEFERTKDCEGFLDTVAELRKFRLKKEMKPRSRATSRGRSK